jgi:cytochrome c6
MKILIFVGAVAMAGILAPVHAQKGQQRGESIFQEQCIGCHGPDGRAQSDMGKKVQAADLTSESIQQQSDSQLSKVIKGGKGKMPAFESKLADDDIKAVLAYVRELGKKH